jgi:tRNA dimethylallyltransferase
MNMKTPLPTLALIAGPTASGKSAVAMELAERAGGVVINADSAQVYADLRVLSARPSVADEARVPHRLFGYIDSAESCSAARWAADARGEIAAAQAAGRLPVLVGGTGLYLRTLIDGIAPVPEIDPAIRAEVRAMPVAEAHRALREADPAAATRLAAADTTRVARALEVVRSTGRTLAAWQDAKAGGIGDAVRLVATILLPEREWLLSRCDARLEAMFDEGAVDEVAQLLARNDIPLAAPIRRAIGVPEIAAMLAGEISRDAALAAAKIATRQYAKRQYTWFRNQPPADWARIRESEKDSIIRQIEIRLLD